MWDSNWRLFISLSYFIFTSKSLCHRISWFEYTSVEIGGIARGPWLKWLETLCFKTNEMVNKLYILSHRKACSFWRTKREYIAFHFSSRIKNNFANNMTPTQFCNKFSRKIYLFMQGIDIFLYYFTTKAKNFLG